MCKSPIMLPGGQLAACRKCWQCRENRINDWVGRCIAESKTSVASHSVTLTYGEDDDGNKIHERSQLLTYSDVQKWFKRLRKAGHEFSYFVVGEYGSKKGRAHWHVMMYWRSAPPAVKLEQNLVQAHWGHGHSFWKVTDEHDKSKAGVRYVCKYIQKDLDDMLRQGHLSMSKIPPLGARYFEQLAARVVEAALAPDELFYSFQGVNDKKGKPIQFKLSGRSAELYLGHYLEKWASTYPGVHPPHCEAVEKYEDRMATPDLGTDYEFDKRPLPPQAPLMVGASHMQYDWQQRTYYCELGGERWYWLKNSFGGISWVKKVAQKEPAPETDRVRQLRSEVARHFGSAEDSSAT